MMTFWTMAQEAAAKAAAEVASGPAAVGQMADLS